MKKAASVAAQALNCCRAAFTVGMVSLFCAAQADAAVVYDNGFRERDEAGFVSDSVLSLDASITIQAADNFSLAAPATLRHVEWEGFYFLFDGDAPPASDDFIVRIYAESSGLPSALLYEDVVGNVSRTPVSFADFTYSADIAPIHLAGGINYFLSIVSSTVDDNAWLWSVSALNSGVLWYSINGTADDWATWIGDLAFRLSDRRHLGQIPEPTTLALIGIGLAGLALGRRKRAAK